MRVQKTPGFVLCVEGSVLVSVQLPPTAEKLVAISIKITTRHRTWWKKAPEDAAARALPAADNFGFD